jgi:hypothetical protein
MVIDKSTAFLYNKNMNSEINTITHSENVQTTVTTTSLSF